jgi:hypothetical protein
VRPPTTAPSVEGIGRGARSCGSFPDAGDARARIPQRRPTAGAPPARGTTRRSTPPPPPRHPRARRRRVPVTDGRPAIRDQSSRCLHGARSRAPTCRSSGQGPRASPGGRCGSGSARGASTDRSGTGAVGRRAPGRRSGATAQRPSEVEDVADRRPPAFARRVSGVRVHRGPGDVQGPIRGVRAIDSPGRPTGTGRPTGPPIRGRSRRRREHPPEASDLPSSLRPVAAFAPGGSS